MVNATVTRNSNDARKRYAIRVLHQTRVVLREIAKPKVLEKEAQAPNEALEYDYSVESGPNDDKHASDKSYHPHPSRLSRSLPQDEKQRRGAEFSQWGLCSGFPDPSTFAFDDEHEQGLRYTQLEAPK